MFIWLKNFLNLSITQQEKISPAIPQCLSEACRHAQNTCLLGRANTPTVYAQTNGWAHTARVRSMMKCHYVYDKEEKTWTLHKVNQKPKYEFNFDQKITNAIPNFMLISYFSHITRIGNCQNLACCAADYLWKHHADKLEAIHIMKMKQVDHVFLVVFDKEGQRWVVDPFVGRGWVYPIDDYSAIMRSTVVQYFQGLKTLNDQKGHHYHLVSNPRQVSLEAVSTDIILTNKPYPQDVQLTVEVNDYTSDIRDHRVQFDRDRKKRAETFKTECLVELSEAFEKKLRMP